MDAEKTFAVVCDVIDDVLARASSRKIEITHVAMCSFWHSLVGIDARGKPTTPVLGWADTRSGKYSTELKKRFDEHDVHNRTGAHFHSSFWPAKLLWLRREQPDVFARTMKWIGFGDYVSSRLTGRCVTSISMASATGVFDQRRCVWDGELLKYLKVKNEHLPKIAYSYECLELTPRYKKRWPQLKNSRLLPAIGDGAADHVGSCGTANRKASVMIGTSAAMRIVYEGSPPNRIPFGLWCYRIDHKNVIVGGALSDGGNLREWCMRTFKLSANAEELIRARDPMRKLPTLLPFFHGERSPGYREGARGEIGYLLPSHDGIDVLHAAMLSVGEQLARIYERLREVASIDEISASGGALYGSPLWCEILCEALAHPISLSHIKNASSVGVVKLVLREK
jgi:gluconokinase